jgi:leader peptidase (prepilin peptidase) / N-methyltransferase
LVRDIRRIFGAPTALTIAIFAGASAAELLFLNWIDAVFGTLLLATALYVAVTDLDRFEIPDIANLIILVVGLAWTLKASEFRSVSVVEALTRSILCSGFFLTVRAVYGSLRNVEGLGLGDVKLAGAGAAWLSWSHTMIALLLAVGAAILLVVMGSLLTQKRIEAKAAIPFGAFLAPAIWVAWFLQIRGL